MGDLHDPQPLGGSGVTMWVGRSLLQRDGGVVSRGGGPGRGVRAGPGAKEQGQQGAGGQASGDQTLEETGRGPGTVASRRAWIGMQRPKGYFGPHEFGHLGTPGLPATLVKNPGPRLGSCYPRQAPGFQHSHHSGSRKAPCPDPGCEGPLTLTPTHSATSPSAVSFHLPAQPDGASCLGLGVWIQGSEIAPVGARVFSGERCHFLP